MQKNPYQVEAIGRRHWYLMSQEPGKERKREGRNLTWSSVHLRARPLNQQSDPKVHQKHFEVAPKHAEKVLSLAKKVREGSLATISLEGI